VSALPKIVGPQTGPTEEVLAPGTTIVGVRFRPGAAPAVLGMPASELVDLAVRLDVLWGASAVALGEKIAASASAQDAASALETEISGRLAAESHFDPVATDAMRRLLPGCTKDVTSLASSLYISERQLRRRCEAAIGLTPKVLHRILRFRGFLALARCHTLPNVGLALLAAEAGYADQSHLSRESLRLTGWSPRALLREVEHHCGAVHDHAASYAPLLRSLALRRSQSKMP
jgi:AraC-like DNA-binding protein